MCRSRRTTRVSSSEREFDCPRSPLHPPHLGPPPCRPGPFTDARCSSRCDRRLVPLCPLPRQQRDLSSDPRCIGHHPRRCAGFQRCRLVRKTDATAARREIGGPGPRGRPRAMTAADTVSSEIAAGRIDDRSEFVPSPFPAPGGPSARASASESASARISTDRIAALMRTPSPRMACRIPREGPSSRTDVGRRVSHSPILGRPPKYFFARLRLSAVGLRYVRKHAFPEALAWRSIPSESRPCS